MGSCQGQAFGFQTQIGRRMGFLKIIGEESVTDVLHHMPMQSTGRCLQSAHNSGEESTNLEEPSGTSALGLLALAYANSSDSDEDRADDPSDLDNDMSIETGSTKTRHLGNPKEYIMKQESGSPDNDVHQDDLEERLSLLGGAHISLICYQDYLRVEAEAKHLAEELGIDYSWNSITFLNATSEDEKMIQSSLDSEEGIPWSGDWTVKLGINLFYSANLCWSPLYSKQMPYNSVIYKAFGRDCFNSPAKSDDFHRGSAKQKKTVAGKWCGKVWMSHRVHPLLVQKDPGEQEEESSFQ
ncbi:hypothetical protein MLD38_021902 [Melastoma candidum]|uniref:Uncharacterized protein n=1 Tax=Melastoma candidum TaxID=119954 RepID=A0ACB9QHE4_9MYRT|nr:hypothetical protein MLD38_021902 [Melastoma candidum]